MVRRGEGRARNEGAKEGATEGRKEGRKREREREKGSTHGYLPAEISSVSIVLEKNRALMMSGAATA